MQDQEGEVMTARKAQGSKAAPVDEPEPEPEPEQVDEPAAPVDEPDDKDRELEALRAELEALRNPPPAPEPEVPDDPRDAAILALKAELSALRSTPEGAAAEMAKALAALQGEVERMKAGQGLVPVPVQTEPDPYLYFARLANGDVIEVQHPTGTHHHTDTHGLVPVESVWHKDPAILAAEAVAAR
jgi:hypothetical protein